MSKRPACATQKDANRQQANIVAKGKIRMRIQSPKTALRRKPVSDFRAMVCLALLVLCGLPGCSTNPATGESQFTALLPPAQEAALGAQEHKKVMESFGGTNDNERLTAYVERIGRSLVPHTERKDVQYRFFVLDSPVVNAFALPGGYIYVTRGLVALANNEAELAAVLAHEIGHITARHAAERYSHGVLTSLGASVLAASVKQEGVANLANLGANLYLKSYSRSQEHQADMLGVRYLERSGYDPFAMASFLRSLDRNDHLQQRLTGEEHSAASLGYFSTHPATSDRFAEVSELARAAPQGPRRTERDAFLTVVNGLVWGDSAKQGFVRGRTFSHPAMGFTFEVPDGYRIVNGSDSVVATSGSAGSVVIFDAASNPQKLDARAYLTQEWMQKTPLQGTESLSINGFSAATASFEGAVNGRKSTIRVVALSWSPERFFRFQIAWPEQADKFVVDGLKRMTYSFRRLSGAEKQALKPLTVEVFTARANDTVQARARALPFTDLQEDRFRTLNGMESSEDLSTGEKYKTIRE